MSAWRHERSDPWLLAALAAIVYALPSLSWIGRAILDDGDAFYAHVGATMLARGDWVTPYANGVRFLDKPPLIYWTLAASYLVFGVTEFAARFPSALAVWGTSLLLWRMGREGGEARAGLLAAVAFTLSAGTLFFTLEVLPDILLVFCLTLALTGFLRWHLSGEREIAPLLALAAGLAGAVLAKSAIGMAFPVAVILLFYLVGRVRPRPSLAHLTLAAALLLALALPWHLLAAARNPGFFRQYFINEQVMRFLGRRYPVDYVSIPVWAFWLLVPVWLFPWSAFLPAARLQHKVSPERAALLRLALCWAGVILGFFTISARLEHYIFPALPPLALMAGLALAGERESERAVGRGFAALAVIGALAALASVAGLVWYQSAGAEWLAQAAVNDRERAYTNLFSPLFALPRSTLASLVAPYTIALAALGAGLIVAWQLNRRRRRFGAVASLAAAMVVFAWCALASLHLCESLLSAKEFGAILNRVYRPGDEVVLVGDYETGNSINFYAPTPIRIYDGMTASLDHGLRYPDAPRMIVTREELEARWNGPARTFLVAPRARVAELGLAPAHEVMESAGRVLLVNQAIEGHP
jgi:4-amino-4-deoxy-L-arabinose transferase-like glycosyltransferase